MTEILFLAVTIVQYCSYLSRFQTSGPGGKGGGGGAPSKLPAWMQDEIKDLCDRWDAPTTRFSHQFKRIPYISLDIS